MNDKKQDEKKLQLVLPFNRRFLKYTFIIIVFIAIVYSLFSDPQKAFGLISKVISVFSPFIIGLCIAYVVNLLMRPTERLWSFIWRKSKLKFLEKCRRPVCLTLSSLLVFGVVFAIVFMIIPELKNTIVGFVDRVPQYAVTVEAWYNGLVDFLSKYNFELPAVSLESEKIGVFFKELLENYGNNVLNTTVNVTASIVSVIFNIVLGIAFSIYVLAQKEKLGRFARNTVNAIFSERRAQKTLELATLTNDVFTRFVTGQLTEAVIIGVLCFIGMLIFRMPYAAVISVLVGFTALIPVFGAFFGTAVGAFLILLESPMKAFWFIVFIIVLQQLEGNLIYPRVVGKSVGIPGMLVLVAVTVGGGFFGILGMLFSVPVCSVLYVVFKQFIEKRLSAKINLDEAELSDQTQEI